MSNFFQKRNNSVSNRFPRKNEGETKYIRKSFSSHKNINKLISTNKSILNHETKSNTIENSSYFSIPIKKLKEMDIENYFLPKNKKVFESPKIINNKKLTFQRQKDKIIFEFPLFDDEMIFKDVNKAYLQDVESDDGNSSSDDNINLGKNILSKKLEEASKEIKINLYNNKLNSLLYRPIRFKKNKK